MLGRGCAAVLGCIGTDKNLLTITLGLGYLAKYSGMVFIVLPMANTCLATLPIPLANPQCNYFKKLTGSSILLKRKEDLNTAIGRVCVKSEHCIGI